MTTSPERPEAAPWYCSHESSRAATSTMVAAGLVTAAALMAFVGLLVTGDEVSALVAAMVMLVAGANTWSAGRSRTWWRADPVAGREARPAPAPLATHRRGAGALVAAGRPGSTGGAVHRAAPAPPCRDPVPSSGPRRLDGSGASSRTPPAGLRPGRRACHPSRGARRPSRARCRAPDGRVRRAAPGLPAGPCRGPRPGRQCRPDHHRGPPARPGRARHLVAGRAHRTGVREPGPSSHRARPPGQPARRGDPVLLEGVSGD